MAGTKASNRRCYLLRRHRQRRQERRRQRRVVCPWSKFWQILFDIWERKSAAKVLRLAGRRPSLAPSERVLLRWSRGFSRLSAQYMSSQS
eukprot:3315792-Prymnesium_polylepis.1